MTTHQTLDPERSDQMRTFLVVEAASSVAAGPPARRPVPLRRTAIAGGAAAALLVGGVALASGDDPAPPPGATAALPTTTPDGPVDLGDFETISVSTEGGWTTVTIDDVDADPGAVLADLRAAGFDAVISVVEPSFTSGLIGIEADGEEITAPAFGVLRQDLGSNGLTGLLVIAGDDPELYLDSSPGETGDAQVTVRSEAGETTLRYGGGESPSVSIREGSDVVTIVVASSR